MNKRFVSLLMATLISLSTFSNIATATNFENESIENEEGEGLQERDTITGEDTQEDVKINGESEGEEKESGEYTSDLNKVKPSEAQDDYVISFKDNNLKNYLKEILKLEETEEITVGNLKSSREIKPNFIYDIKESKNFSAEGLQYLPQSVTSMTLKNGEYFEGILSPLKGRLESIDLDGFGLREIPIMNEFKDIKKLYLKNNEIRNMNNIEFYNDITSIIMDNNLIDDISALSCFDKLETVLFNNNRISDISALKTSKDTLSNIKFDNNKLTTKSIEDLFKNDRFIKFDNRKGDIYFKGNRITDFSSLAPYHKPQTMAFANQHIVKVIDQPEFELSLVTYKRQQREYITESYTLDLDEDETAHGKIIKVSEDNNDNLYKIDTEDLDDGIINVKWNKAHYTEVALNFSGLLEIVNLIPINKIVQEAEDNPSEGSIEIATNELNKLREKTKEIESSELDEKLNAIENRINLIDTSQPAEPQVVKFTDRIFEDMMKNAYQRITGERKEQLTADDMKEITNIDSVKDLNYIKLEDGVTSNRVFVNDIEGIQYAKNLTSISLNINGMTDERKYDEDYKLISFKNKLYEKHKDSYKNEIKDGNFYEHKKLWGSEIIADILNEKSNRFTHLKELENIEILNLQYTSVNSNDLEDIGEVTSLKKLYLDGNIINDIKPLEKLENLEALTLNFNLIEDLSPVSNLQKLTDLAIAQNKINDWKPLKDMSSLRILNLNSNRIDDKLYNLDENLDCIKNLNNLNALSLQDNGITDIIKLKDLMNLYTLRLTANHIQDFSPLINLNNIGNNPNGGNKFEAYLQTHFIMLEDGNYKFDFPLKNIDGKEVFLNLQKPKDLELKKIKDSEYELINKNAVSFSREYLNYVDRGQMGGRVFIYNKNRIEELVKRAKDNPTEDNLASAYNALDKVYHLSSQRNYVETTRAELEELKNKPQIPIKPEVPTPPTKPTDPEPPVDNIKLPPGISDEGSEGTGEGSSVEFDFVPAESTIKNGDKNVSLDSLVMFKFNKAVSHSDILGQNLDKIMVHDESGNKVNVDITAAPKNVKKPSKYQDQNEFELDYRKYLTVNFLEGLKANKTYTVTLRSSIQAKNGATTAQAYDITFSTIGASRPPVIPPYTPPVAPTILVTDVELNKSEAIIEGSSVQLQAGVNPSNATNKDITWSSSDKSIATVDSTGKVTGVSEGVVTITATTVYGNKTASCEVTVTKNITDIKLNETEIIIENSSLQLQITTEPSDEIIKDLKWTSSDESIVTVDESGKITGVNKGVATVTVTTADGNSTASSIVTVIEDLLLDLDLDEENSEKIVKIEPKYEQPKDKEWTVKFNQKLKDAENLKSSVFVLDENNILQNVEVIIGDDLKSIKIIPSREEYKSGVKYRIIIKDIKNENNQTLKKPTLMDFTVK